MIESCTIITTKAASEFREEVHKRTPVILGTDDALAWMDPATPTATLDEMLQPGQRSTLTWHAVDRAINTSSNKAAPLRLDA